MRAAIYARYSTDRQAETSTADQVRECRRRAESEGFDVVQVFTDDAISGSTRVESRPGGAALLAGALSARFDVVLVEGLDRLSRDTVDQETVVRRLEHRGIRIVGVSDAYDSAASGRKLTRQVRGLINEIYLDDLRSKTRRGLAGAAARGTHTGGRCYGFRTVPDPAGGARLVVDPVEAEFVREIFRRYAAGEGMQSIVFDLNRRRIAAPRGGTWAVSALYGSPNKGSGILNNAAYTGRVVWNRSAWVTDPDSRRRVRIARPPAEWSSRDEPALRIVDAATWDAVRDRMTRTLFGGLLTCGRCGGAVVAVNAHAYGCAARKDRGPAVCEGVAAPRKVVDARLLSELRSALLSPAAIAQVRRDVVAAIRDQRANAGTDRDARIARAAELAGEIDRLVDAIAAVGHSPALVERLTRAEAERTAIGNPRTSGGQVPDGDAVAAAYRRAVVNLGEVLKGDAARARAALADVFGALRLVPADDGVFVQADVDVGSIVAAVSGDVDLGRVAGARNRTQIRARVA